MQRSRMQNAKRNIAGGLFNHLISILSTFCTRTVLIYSLGSLYAGLSTLFSSILSILNLAELGFGSAMVFSMYEPIAKGDTEQVNALLNLYKRIYHVIGCVVLGLGLCFIPFLPKMIRGEVPPGTNLYVLYAINLVNTVLGYLLFAYRSALFSADQRGYLNNLIISVTSVIVNVLQVCILIFLHDFYLYFLVLPIMTGIKNIWTYSVTRKLYPDYNCEGEVSAEEKKNIRGRVAGVFVEKLCTVSRNSFDSIIISSFLGLTMLTRYSNYYTILGAVSGMTGAITQALTSSIGHSMVMESREKNYADFLSIQLLYMWICAFCTVCMYCLFQPFVKLWVGESLMLDQGVMTLFCIYFFTAKMGNVCFAYRQAAGLWGSDKVRPLVEACSNLVFNILLARFFGVGGVLISSILGLIFLNTLWGSRVLFKKYFVDQKQRFYLLRIAYYGVVTLIACAAASLVCGWIPFEGMVGILLRFMVCVISAVTILPLLFCRMPEFQNTIRLAKRMLHLK